jgi:hypothetical protein
MAPAKIFHSNDAEETANQRQPGVFRLCKQKIHAA